MSRYIRSLQISVTCTATAVIRRSALARSGNAPMARVRRLISPWRSAAVASSAPPETRSPPPTRDETRLRVIALLSHGELCVCHLEKAGSQPAEHLSPSGNPESSGASSTAAAMARWVYYKLTEQEHDAVQIMLGTLTKSFGAEKTIRADHAKLRKSCGPNACK